MLCVLVVSTVTVLFFGRCLVSRHWQHLQPLLLQQIQQQSLGHCHLHRAMMASSQVPRTTEMWRGFTGSKWSKGIKIWPYLTFYLLLPAASVFPGCVITCKKNPLKTTAPSMLEHHAPFSFWNWKPQGLLMIIWNICTLVRPPQKSSRQTMFAMYNKH